MKCMPIEEVVSHSGWEFEVNPSEIIDSILAKGLESEPVPVFYLSPEAVGFWKANGGNAKARRRWRRRNVPNTQRTQAIARAEAVFERRLERDLSWGRRGLGAIAAAAVVP